MVRRRPDGFKFIQLAGCFLVKVWCLVSGWLEAWTIHVIALQDPQIDDDITPPRAIWPCSDRNGNPKPEYKSIKDGDCSGLFQMEQRRPPEYILEVFADPSSVKDVVKGILHTIFFHRFFPSVRPRTHDVLDLTLPVVGDAELETLIEQKTSSLIRQLDTTSDLGSRSSGVRGQIAVQFFEKRRRKAWFTKGEEEVCWEQWTLDVTLAIPRTESERAKVRKAMETMLLKTAMKIVTTVNREKDHIPPITTSEANPFPYQISTNPKGDGWGARIGIF